MHDIQDQIKNINKSAQIALNHVLNEEFNFSLDSGFVDFYLMISCRKLVIMRMSDNLYHQELALTCIPTGLVLSWLSEPLRLKAFIKFYALPLFREELKPTKHNQGVKDIGVFSYELDFKHKSNFGVFDAIDML